MSYKEKAKEYSKRYKQEHKEHVKEYNKRYYQEHKEQINSRRLGLYNVNKEKKKEYARRYYAAHKEQINSRRRLGLYNVNKENKKEYDRRYYVAHKEQIREQQKNYRYGNGDKIHACNKHWSDKENEAVKKYIRKIKTRWTAEEEKTLIDLHEEGLTYTEIAMVLGRSRGAINNKIVRMHKERKAEAKDDLM